MFLNSAVFGKTGDRSLKMLQFLSGSQLSVRASLFIQLRRKQICNENEIASALSREWLCSLVRARI